MLGYDVRKYQLAAFVIGAALAGLSGVLYTTWGQYITPSSMGITAAALPIVWVAVGGRSDLTATLIGTLVVLGGFQALTDLRQPVRARRDGRCCWCVTVLLAPEGSIARRSPNSAARLVGARRDGSQPDGASRDSQAQQALRRPARHRRRRPCARAGRASLPDRTERRRQEHAVPPDPRRVPAVAAADLLRRRGHHRAEVVRSGSGAASASSSRCPASSRR